MGWCNGLQPRVKIQKKRVDKLIKYFKKKYYNFEYIDAGIFLNLPYNKDSQFGTDDQWLVFLGSLICRVRNIKKMWHASFTYNWNNRKAFGKEINQHQAVAFKLADMATKIQCAELLIHQACDLKMKGLPMTKESAMAKYYASEIAVEISTDAVQIFGGYGYTKDFPVEKFYRDAKLCTIGEGTSEIQKIVIAREVLQ
jgi:hypothetical protein